MVFLGLASTGSVGIGAGLKSGQRDIPHATSVLIGPLRGYSTSKSISTASRTRVIVYQRVYYK
jgi:hypothetical protein